MRRDAVRAYRLELRDDADERFERIVGYGRGPLQGTRCCVKDDDVAHAAELRYVERQAVLEDHSVLRRRSGVFRQFAAQVNQAAGGRQNEARGLKGFFCAREKAGEKMLRREGRRVRGAIEPPPNTVTVLRRLGHTVAEIAYDTVQGVARCYGTPAGRVRLLEQQYDGMEPAGNVLCGFND
jgi:hypothetical protein